MNCNQLPPKYSFVYRFIKFIKGQKIGNELKREKLSVGLKETFITEIEPCEDPVVQNLFKELLPFQDSVSIYLHGSWADDTKTSFSDLDDFIILDLRCLRKNGQIKKVFSLLNRIDMKFCRLDPLQHHGHWIVSREELSNYDNSFMPLYIFKDAKTVLGSNVILGKLNPVTTKKGITKNIINTCEGIKKLSDKFFNNSINAYELKGLVGSFALMPAFIMQAKGYNYTKPEAINLADSIYSEKALSCLKWSTECRENWSLVTNNKRFKFFGLFSYVCFDPHLWRRFSKSFSPRIKKSTSNKLSQVLLTELNIHKFISESLKHAS